MAKLPWKPWHEVVALRDDLKTGDLSLQMFAADLYEVMMRRGKQPVYEQPENFFALTFPTHNLRNLVRDVALRLANKNDKAVRQLELTYGGGKTHTLITLQHLVNNPDGLPDLPAVREFRSAIGQKPPKARVAALCFDKLDVEKGMEVRAPDGKSRRLKHPWSVLAYQIAGDEGLKLLHAEGKSQERETAPAENTLSELLELPGKEDLGILVLMDEVLMYAKEKVNQEGMWRDRLINFFQYLTQAATKVPRCCIVASLLATDPKKTGDELGRQLLGNFYDIFRREKEEGVEPVVKEDVAEVLRRRFFTPESIRDLGALRPHVIAALKGLQAVDEQTAKAGATAEDRFLRSYPFHPDLTEVLYAKWTQMRGFQRTRGVLRTFALALREAAQWDASPLVGPAALLNAPGEEDLSEAMRELSRFQKVL
jgi:predicted AAA+ superfamily ATPase